jgi:hypothetical protein
MTGLTLVATFAMSAIVVPAASAGLPEWIPATGTFTGTSSVSTFETKSGEKVKCSSGGVTGELTGSKTNKATLTFKGCEAFGFKCNSSGAGSGEIVLNMTGQLVYIMKATKEVGLLNTLTAELTIKCSAFQTLKVKGSTLCQITPINTPTTKFKVVCKATKGAQEPANYEPGSELIKAPITEIKGEGMKNFAFEQSGLTTTYELTFANAVEIRA